MPKQNWPAKDDDVMENIYWKIC